MRTQRRGDFSNTAAMSHRGSKPDIPMREAGGYAISKVDGSPLYYALEGPRQRAQPLASIMLSDGIGCDGFVWKYVRRDLSAQYRLVHWHYPGHGRSAPPRDPAAVSIPHLADRLVDVLDDCELETAILFGHSMGVQVSLEAYRRHPQRVGALALFCGMAENPLKTFHGTAALENLLPRLRALVDRAPGLFNRLTRVVLPTRLAHTVASRIEVNADLLDKEDLHPYLRGLSHVEPRLFLAMLAEAGQHSAVDMLSSVNVPVLIVAGDRDGFTPPSLSQALADAIPGAEILMVENGSHTAPLERPDLVNEVVLDFLRRRAAPSP
jgi:pimeloyl-ACP methyl ester carboxylesterase